MQSTYLVLCWIDSLRSRKKPIDRKSGRGKVRIELGGLGKLNLCQDYPGRLYKSEDKTSIKKRKISR